MERCAIFMNESVNIVAIPVLPKLIYKFNVIPIKISIIFLMELDKIILKLMWKSKTDQDKLRTKVGDLP